MALRSILQEDLQCLRTLKLKGPQDTGGPMGEWAGLECGRHRGSCKEETREQGWGSLVRDTVSQAKKLPLLLKVPGIH